MRHRKSGIKLNRTGSHRNAMFRNMVTSLFKYDRIKTTEAKAKELRRWADHLVTLAKKGDLHARRQAMAIIREKKVVHRLFEEVEKRFGNRQGGYTRIVKIGRRKGDAAPMTIIELTDSADLASRKKKKEVKNIPDPKTLPGPETEEQEADQESAIEENTPSAEPDKDPEKDK